MFRVCRMALRPTGLAASDSRAAYRELYAPICGYALRRVHEPEDATEVIAETFATLWRRFDLCPQDDELRPWPFGVARRVLANQRRGERRRSTLGERLAAHVLPTATAAADEAPNGAPRRVRRFERVAPGVDRWTGTIASVRRLADAYGFTDTDGNRPNCWSQSREVRLGRSRGPQHRRVPVAERQALRPHP